ncbi:MAG: hypothetical protein AAGJ94_10285 [Pseudomonadota bacterium]
MRKFLVIGAARTGSTLLMQIIQSSPDVKAHFELFHKNVVHIDGVDRSDEIPQRDAQPFEWLDGVLSSSNKPMVGFKIFPNQNDEVLDALIEDDDVAKIVLFRENFLAVYSSLLISTARADWSQSADDATTLGKIDLKSHTWGNTVEFDAADFQARYDAYIGFYRRSVKKLVNANQKFLFIEYAETLNEDLMRRIFPFLGVAQPETISVNLKKNNTSRIMTRFSNRDAVKDYLTQVGKWDWSSESFFVW